jgi:predicted dehydrogenase
MSKKEIRIGIVGCGFITQEVHLPALRRSKGANVVALCDMNVDTAKKVAQKFGVGKSYGDVADMLKNEKLDVLDVCTSISTHAAIAIQGMEAGCDILLEKPMAANLTEADQELAVAKKTGKKICVIHQLLFHPMIIKMKRLVASGALGDITRVEIRQSTPPWDYPPVNDPKHWWQRLSGGIYGDTLPHSTYLTRAFIGKIEPVAVYSNKLGKYAHLPVDDLQILYKGEKGLGTVFASCNWPSLWEVDLLGTKKIAHADLNNSYLVVYDCKTNNGRGILSNYIKGNISRSMQILGTSVQTGIKMLSGEHRGHFAQIKKFIESLQNDTPLPITGEDDREITRLVESVISKM